MIFRTVKDKNNPYTRLGHATINDERLSYKAIGIHTYLMSKPDDWQANEADITARHSEGKSAVRSGVQELIQYGYMARVQLRKDKKIVGWRLDVYESPEVNPHYDLESPVDYVVIDLDSDNKNVADLDSDKQDVDNLNLDNRNVGAQPEDEQSSTDLDSDYLDLDKQDVGNRNHSKDPIEVTNNNNKEGGGGRRAADAAYGTLCKAVENEIGLLSPMAAEKLGALADEHPHDWILDALRIAVNQNKRSLAYVEGILTRWKAEGRDSPKPQRRAGPVDSVADASWDKLFANSPHLQDRS